jgi:hypothetical protein
MINAIQLAGLWAAGDGGSVGLLAYIDPGAGSFIFQMLVAGLLTALVALRAVRDKVRALFSGVFTKGRPEVEGKAPITDAQAESK